MWTAYRARFDGQSLPLMWLKNRQWIWHSNIECSNMISEGGQRSWNFGSVLIVIVHILKNPVNSYDSNGVIAVPISILGDKEQNLPFFCLLIIPSESAERIGSYYTSLERYFQGDYNAVGIVRNGSGLTEKFRKSVLRIQALGGNAV